ncbi:MAG: DUF4149 domain-containing protein [Chloroflexota bacterium]
MPAWALTLAYWLHMAATVAWIGGLFFQAAVLAPVLTSSLSSADRVAVLESLRRRFEPLAWLSLTVLVATGLIQMSANPNYQGFLAITNRWALAILVKHVAVALMVILAAYQTWVVHPRLARQAWQQARGIESTEASPGSLVPLARLNLVLGLIVLALTAFARAA